MVNFNIGFTADTSQAKRAIAELTRELNNIGNASAQDLGFARISSDLTDAKAAALELREHLKLATNVNTGKLDISKFNMSLQKSNTSLISYVTHLQNLGPAGQQSFRQLTNAILSAEVPAKKLNKLFSDLLVSFKNTFTWQISSSVLMGFTGAISSALNYAQDLNKSLNDIRIVTGQSTEQMAKFAKEANKAAKNLSTTTTAYTDAALIYYQQGLTDDEVVERTNATVKMANVTGENAQNVSSYMTAIWNNFDDGSKSLEYYADVITALGAATASSSEEIAGGLEKFAAIGQTVGLSYEYATAALATVVSETRQSEDVVGTSFKTIFARLQGLQQGEEQEDGVTLNKYSAALKSIGIDIIETNGELKAMDDILNELGSKWETLGEAEKVALAQTVGGVRQYTQLISLMENWDTFQDNLNVAYKSEGSLTEQNEIYEESWIAATNRITAALEEMWDALLNDKAFIKFFDIIADFIDLLDNVVDGLGGFKGLLTSIGTIATRLFKKEMTAGFENLQLFLTPRKQLERQQAETQGNMISLFQNANRGAFKELDDKLWADKLTLVEISQDLNDADKFRLETLIKIQEKELETLHTNEEALEVSRQELQVMLEMEEADEEVRKQRTQARQSSRSWNSFKNNINKINFLPENVSGKEIDNFKDKIKNYFKKEGFLDVGDVFKKNSKLSDSENNELQKLFNLVTDKNNTNNPQKLNEDFEKLKDFLDTISGDYIYIKNLRTSLIELSEDENNEFKLTSEQIQEVINYEEKRLKLKRDTAATEKNSNKAREYVEDLRKRQNQVTGAQNLTQSVEALTSSLGVVNSVIGIWESLMDESTSTADKFASAISSVASGIFQGVNAFNAFKKAFEDIKNISDGSGLLKTLGTFGPYIAAAIVGIYALIQVFKLWEKHVKENSIEEKTKRLTEETNKLKTEYDNLNSSINNLKSARETLNDLTEGTQEWKQAVIDINQQVLDLLALYPQLAQFVTNKDGILGISSEGFDLVLDEQQKLLETHQASLFSMQAEQAKKMAGSITDIYYNKSNNEIFATRDGTNATSVASGTELKINQGAKNSKIDIGDAVELYRTALNQDGAFGEGGFNFDKFTGETKELYDKIVKEQGINGKEIESFQKALNDAIPTLGQLSNEFSAAATKVQTFRTQGVKSWLENTNAQVDNDLTDVYANAIAAEMEKVEVALPTSEEDWKATYAEQTGIDVSRVSYLIEQGTLTLENVKNAVETTLKMEAAKVKVDERLNNLPSSLNGLGLEETNIIKGILLAGGDKSSWNAIHEDNTQNVIDFLEENKDSLGGLLNDNQLIQTIIDSLRDPNYQEEANINRQERFDANAESIASDYGMDLSAFRSYQTKLAKDIPELNTLIKEQDTLANEIAEKYLKWDKNAKKVNETLEDTKDALANKKDIVKYKQALTTLANSLTDLFGFEVSSDFVEKNYKKIKKAFEKNDKKEIKKLFDESIIAEVELKVPEDKKDEMVGTVKEVLDIIKQEDLDIGEWIHWDSHKLTDKLYSLAEQMGWGAENASKEFEKRFGIKVKYQKYPIVNGKITMSSGDELVEDVLGSYKGSFEANGFVEIPVGFEYTGTPGTGGGGGGKKPSGTKKDKKKKSDEIERYHEIRNTIEDLNKQLDETNKKKDRAFGKGKLKAYDDEISKLNELKDAQKQYLDEIDSNLKKDKNTILKYGVKFDENGNISNYDEVMEAQLNKFNKKRTEKAEKEYEEFKKLIEQYEETHDLLLDEQAKLEDLQNQIHDEGLAAAAYKVEYQIELNDDDVEFLDYLIDQLSDNVTSLVEKIALIESKMVESLDNYGIYMDGIKDIFTNLNATRDKDSQLSEEVINRIINGDFTTEDLENWGLVGENSDLTAEDMSKLSEYRDSLLQTAKDLSDYQAAIYETISEGIEKTNAEFDKYSERLEHMFGLWEHFKNIVELTGNKYLGISKEMILALNKDAVQSKVAQVATDAENLSLLREQLKKFQDENGDFLAGEYAKTESSVEELKKQYQELQAAVNEAENNLLSSWEDALSAANDLFQMSVETAIAAFEEGISGTYGSLDMLQDAYDKQKDLGDLYLDDYKQIYELSKLTRDINKSIDDTDNIASKNKLREIQQEINDLQEAGVELSQYDLDFLRAKYELRLAEIALEDAQNAKSQVRMTRDNEGNWSYTYTADQDNIDKAQQNYEDKLYAIQNLTSNYITTVEEQILALQNSMVDEMAGVDKTLYASEEEYLARLAEIQDYYTQKMDALSGQINNALGNNKEIYENDWKAYSEATDYKISANEKYIDSWNETQLSLLGGYETLEEYQETFMNLLGSIDDENSLIGQLASAYRSWSDVVEQISAATGMSIDELAKKIQTIPEESQVVTDEMKAMSEEMATAWEGILQGLQDFTETLAETLQGVLDDVKNSVADLIALMKALYNYEESPDDGSSDPGSEPPPVSAASGGYTGSWGASGKLAILHEKELILNAEDTRNMLKVVGMTRDIAKQIELNAIAAGSGLSNFAPGSVGQFQEVKQNIVINADFPNASNREEIAAAFDNLLNRASQYANRK